VATLGQLVFVDQSVHIISTPSAYLFFKQKVVLIKYRRAYFLSYACRASHSFPYFTRRFSFL